MGYCHELRCVHGAGILVSDGDGKHSDQFRPDLLGNGESFTMAMKYHMSRFYGPSLHVAMNELDNHDHSRFLTRTNQKVGRVAHLGSAAAEEGVNKAVLRGGRRHTDDVAGGSDTVLWR